jgi:double-stranded uracil-DNA glycosylase
LYFMPPLRDILIPHPRILFVGINPSLRSEQAGHHFASPGNPFYRLLYEARLIPAELTYLDDQRLGEFGLALTNLCARATRSASELTSQEIKRGAQTLIKKIGRLQPEVTALVGVSIYGYLFGKAGSPGPGAKPQIIHGARVFVLPNPSGLNASFPGFRDKLVWFEGLREFIARDED